MLKVKEGNGSALEHDFVLNDPVAGNPYRFTLSSGTYPDVTIDLDVPTSNTDPPTFGSAQVYFFKNAYYLPKDIVELRLSEIAANNGLVGYFFRLDSIFDSGAITLDEHTFPYVYRGLENILGANNLYQQLMPDYVDLLNLYEHFFTQETIVLILNNDLLAAHPTFNIINYLPDLYKYGFLLDSNDAGKIKQFNNHPLVSTNYRALSGQASTPGVFFLRIQSTKASLITESYFGHLFMTLVSNKNDEVTRFVMAYQVFEILIDKVLHYLLSSTVCPVAHANNGHSLKKLLRSVAEEEYRITQLFGPVFTNIPPALKTDLKRSIIQLLGHVGDTEPNLAGLSEEKLFYKYRNKLVHNYRLLNHTGPDPAITLGHMNDINEITELIVAYLITTYLH